MSGGLSSLIYNPFPNTYNLYNPYVNILWSTLFMCVAYGVVVALCLQCFAMLVKGFNIGRSTSRRDGLLILYTILIFVVSTIYTGVTLDGMWGLNRMTWHDYRVLHCASYSILVVATLSDALLLWRCTVVYKHSFIPDWLMKTAALTIFIAECALRAVFLAETASAIGMPFNRKGSVIRAPLWFWYLSLVVNIPITAMITSRIIFFRLARVLGYGHVSHYTGIIAMIVESALLHSVYLFLYFFFYITPSAREDLLWKVFFHEPSLVQAVSTLMIVYRVAQGKAWNSDTRARIDTPQQPARGRPVQPGNLATLKTAYSTAFVDDTEKGSFKRIRATNDVGVSSYSGSI